MNGVAHCALQTARHLVDRGHAPLVVAPATAAGHGPDRRAPSSVSPPYRSPATPRSASLSPAHASPLRSPNTAPTSSTWPVPSSSASAAWRPPPLGVPAVAVYQTDLAGYARTYVGAGEATAWRIRSVHAAADRTLAPSSAALHDLEAHGVPLVRLWPRGVDTVRFRPEYRDEALRRELAPNGELIVGYVGRRSRSRSNCSPEPAVWKAYAS